MVAIAAVHTFGMRRREGGWRWLALAMLPALGSAMAACTWHLFDNPDQLRGLVVFQAGLTALGNACLALASWNLLRQQRRGDALLPSGLAADLAAGSELPAPPAPQP
jgi:peptidoglycan/LPS O-acetylase OafA/YrhL